MVERGQQLRFPAEARHALGVVGKDLRQDFQRQVAVEVGVYGLVG